MPVLPAAGYTTPAAPTIEPLLEAGTPYQRINVSPEAFGSGVGQAFQGLGTSFDKAAANAEAAVSFHDQVTVDEQKNFYDDFTNKKLYGDPNTPGDVGYMGLQGKNALETREQIRKDLDGMRMEQRSKLSNAHQLILFDSETSRLRNIALSAVGRHYDEQYNKYAAETAESGVKLAFNGGSVAGNNNDFGAFKTHLGNALSGYEIAEKLNGKDPQTIELGKIKIIQAFTSDWADKAILRNPQEGRAFVIDHKNELGDKYDEKLGKAEQKAHEYDVNEIANGRPPTMSQPNLVRGGAVQGAISGGGQEHYNFIRSIGGSHNEAVVLTAGADVESGFNADATHDANTLAAKGQPPGFGMYGHNTDRLVKMQEQYGPHPTWDQQARFALAELRSRPEGARVNAAKTPEELTAIQEDFESPKRTPEGTAKRLAATRRYMNASTGTSTAPALPAASAGSDAEGANVTVTGQDGQSHELTPAQAQQYFATKDFRTQQQFLAALPVEGAAPTKPTGQLEPGNINLRTRPTVKNADGSYSTVASMSFNDDGKEVLIPKVAADGTSVLSDKDAIAQYRETGQHLGKFDTPAHATDYAEQLHNDQAKLYDPQVAGKPPDILIPGAPPLPPLERDELPDSEIPGLTQRLNAAAKALPPNAPIKLWHDAVKQIRQEENAKYTAQLHVERMRAIAQQRTDDDLGHDYQERMAPGSTNYPTEAEIRKDKRISNGQQDNLIAIMRSNERPDPHPSVSTNNMTNAFTRMTQPEGTEGRLNQQSELDGMFSRKEINWQHYTELSAKLAQRNDATTAEVQRHTAQLMKDAESVLFPTKHIEGGLGVISDPGGPMRERAYQFFIESTIKSYKEAGKNLNELFDPGPPEHPNPNWLGRRSILDYYAKGARGYGTLPKGNVLPDPTKGEFKRAEDVGAAFRAGRFGPPDSPEAQASAAEYLRITGLAKFKPPNAGTGVPAR